MIFEIIQSQGEEKFDNVYMKVTESEKYDIEFLRREQ